MRNALLGLAVVGLLATTACASYNQQRGAATGAALGGGAGAIIGHQFGKRDAGALIGSALGATTGMFYGQNEDALQSRDAPRRYNQGGQRYQGGDDFRNPYKQPDPRYCNGQWNWDAGSAFWLCR